jgi:hypothetical protein
LSEEIVLSVIHFAPASEHPEGFGLRGFLPSFLLVKDLCTQETKPSREKGRDCYIGLSIVFESYGADLGVIPYPFSLENRRMKGSSVVSFAAVSAAGILNTLI